MISTCFLPPVFVISLQCIPINRSRDGDFIIFLGGNWGFSVTCLEAVCLRTNEIPKTHCLCRDSWKNMTYIMNCIKNKEFRYSWKINEDISYWWFQSLIKPICMFRISRRFFCSCLPIKGWQTNTVHIYD